jgi:hypothetical protein
MAQLAPEPPVSPRVVREVKRILDGEAKPRRRTLKDVAVSKQARRETQRILSLPNPSRRRGREGYRLHVESITYLGDDGAAAKGIQEFLRLCRLAENERATQLEPNEVRDVDGTT